MNPEPRLRSHQGESRAGRNGMLYFDNAATSFPKAPGVSEAITDFLTRIGSSTGRSSHRLARQADALVWDVRTLISELLGVRHPERVVFCLNVTQALNIALMGLLEEKDHVVTTSMEHNSVMRPLRHLESNRGIRLTVVPCGEDGVLDTDRFASAITPQTRLVVMAHASNVTGGILPVEEVSRSKRDALLLVDAAQTAGALPIDMEEMGIDMLAFTGHKALLGPPGIGGLCLGPHVALTPLIRGGTGTSSESFDHPTSLPHALEAGTQNMVGLAGLRASLVYLKERGIGAIKESEMRHTRLLLDGLGKIKGLRLYGSDEPAFRMPVVSLNLPPIHPGHLATILEEGYGIMTRAGLHCAPAAHRTIGTFPEGTLRISPGSFHTKEHIQAAIGAMAEISKQFPQT